VELKVIALPDPLAGLGEGKGNRDGQEWESGGTGGEEGEGREGEERGSEVSGRRSRGELQNGSDQLSRDIDAPVLSRWFPVVESPVRKTTHTITDRPMDVHDSSPSSPSVSRNFIAVIRSILARRPNGRALAMPPGRLGAASAVAAAAGGAVCRQRS